MRIFFKSKHKIWNSISNVKRQNIENSCATFDVWIIFKFCVLKKIINYQIRCSISVSESHFLASAVDSAMPAARKRSCRVGKLLLGEGFDRATFPSPANRNLEQCAIVEWETTCRAFFLKNKTKQKKLHKKIKKQRLKRNFLFFWQLFYVFEIFVLSKKKVRMRISWSRGTYRVVKFVTTCVRFPFFWKEFFEKSRKKNEFLITF